jgi:hypothetical protein
MHSFDQAFSSPEGRAVPEATANVTAPPSESAPADETEKPKRKKKR